MDPPDLGTMTAVAWSMFCGKVFVSLGFSRRREFIGGRAMSGVDQGSTPPAGAAREWPAPPYGAAALWPCSVSPLDSFFVSGK
jgi:hypothetical protein